MLFVIEGADGTGKSTLARRILEATGGGRYIHANAPTRHPLVEYTEPLIEYRPGGETWVLDRWHLGELVYGPLYRGKAGLSPQQFAAVDEYLSELGAVLILMHEDPKVLAHRLRERGEEPDVGALATESQAFNQVWLRATHLPGFRTRAVEIGRMELVRIIDKGRERERGVAHRPAA
jgi:hypothetical protein